jgi:3-oxoisoapionate decarboxylase
MRTDVGSFSRRGFLSASTLAVVNARRLLAASTNFRGRLGICSFSCHRQWQAVHDKSAKTSFKDGSTFFDYGRELGADGVQTNVSSLDEISVNKLRMRVDSTGAYLEGDIRIPKDEKDLDKFEHDVVVSKKAGAMIARSFLSGSRRYEKWETRQAFLEFRRQASLRLAMIEPILEKHRFKLAVENHKDLTTHEMVDLLDEFHSEWLGVNVDTGNNIALLEDPLEAVERLAPYALSVHLKDMALQPHEKGFRLSEISCGHGCLNLVEIVARLIAKNPLLNFSLEMATRDPLVIPCSTDEYWNTFEERDNAKVERMLAWVTANPPKHAPPTITGKSLDQQITEEERNNRSSLSWMHANLV